MRPDAEGAVEVGQNVSFFYDQIGPQGKRVVRVDPPRLALVSRAQKKTARHAAPVLARFRKLGWRPTVSVPDKRVRHRRQLFQARESLVERATKLKNMGHGVLTRKGLAHSPEAFRSRTSRERLRTLPGLPAADPQGLPGVRRHLDALEQEITAVAATLVHLGKAWPGLPRVLQVPGLSLLSALGL